MELLICSLFDDKATAKSAIMFLRMVTANHMLHSMQEVPTCLPEVPNTETSLR